MGRLSWGTQCGHTRRERWPTQCRVARLGRGGPVTGCTLPAAGAPLGALTPTAGASQGVPRRCCRDSLGDAQAQSDLSLPLRLDVRCPTGHHRLNQPSQHRAVHGSLGNLPQIELERTRARLEVQALPDGIIETHGAGRSRNSSAPSYEVIARDVVSTHRLISEMRPVPRIGPSNSPISRTRGLSADTRLS